MIDSQGNPGTGMYVRGAENELEVVRVPLWAALVSVVVVRLNDVTLARLVMNDVLEVLGCDEDVEPLRLELVALPKLDVV
jgi:hypothetical protein